jgi:hypothetical protein
MNIFYFIFKKKILQVLILFMRRPINQLNVQYVYVYIIKPGDDHQSLFIDKWIIQLDNFSGLII